MSIAQSTRLGHFEVDAAIDAGGVGDVYKTSDTRQDRLVAITVLPKHVADRLDVREWSEHELQILCRIAFTDR